MHIFLKGKKKDKFVNHNMWFVSSLPTCNSISSSRTQTLAIKTSFGIVVHAVYFFGVIL